MSRSYWLVKSEPSVYSWSKLVDEGTAVWDGIRSFEARNNLRAMKKGDLVLYYHSNEGKAVVGVAKVSREAFPDETGKGDGKGDWSAVELEPVKALPRPVTLDELRAHKTLSKMMIIRRPRI